MLLIHPDENRHIKLAGVLKPVRRPVDIDEAITGFHRLRTLRIYEFETGSIIEGHAENDEVYLIILAGTIELAIVAAESDLPLPTTMSAPENTQHPCVAYLPPGASYRLNSRTAASVAYARATPTAGRPPKTFTAVSFTENSENAVLLDCDTYAERLRLRLVAIGTHQNNLSLSPFRQEEINLERLAHLRYVHSIPNLSVTIGQGGESIQLASSDTAALSPGDRLTLKITTETRGVILLLMA